jgi:hypothetical protein
MISNKIVAILGVLAYLLSVAASVTNLDGTPSAPTYLVIVSLLVSVVFYILASVRLWKINRLLTLLLIGSSLGLLVLEYIHVSSTPMYGSMLVVSTNAMKVIMLVVYFLSLRLLWISEK